MTSDYFDHVERELRGAVRRHAHLPWYLRVRARHSRALVVAVAALVIAGPSLAAVSLLQSGSSVGPGAPLTPKAFNGVALGSSVRLLSLRVPDPEGGPPWGMRLLRTSRGLLCMQVGRVAFGKVGALGRDDAFGDDGRFHPFSANYAPGPGSACVTPDARGDGFYNVAAFGVPASALFEARGVGGGCIPSQSARPRFSPTPAIAALRGRRTRRTRAVPACPVGDLRQVYYGLLGPQAVSVTHVTASGSLVTTPTGPDGAYLVVLPNRGPASENDTATADSSLFPGAIRAVHYRDGHSCRVPAPRSLSDPGRGSCPPVGYVPSNTRVPSPAQVASSIIARVVFAPHYCDRRETELVVACPGGVPPGFQRIDMSRGPAEALVQISFTSRVAITNGHSYYYFRMNRPPYRNTRYPSQLECAGAGDFGQSNSDYAAGQRVTFSVFENLSCRGPVHGTVSLVITTGPATPAPTPAVAGRSVGREVGSFGFTLP